MALLILLIVPLIASLALACIGDRKYAPEVNILGSASTFGASVQLALQVYARGPILAGNDFFFIDAFSVYLTVLTALVSMTTSIFSRRYMRREREHGTVGHRRMRFYHSTFQLFIFAMLLCLLTNNVGVLWIAMELATLSTVLLVSLYRTPAAMEAAWKYFILCGVGISLALFGTVLLYFAAEKVLETQALIESLHLAGRVRWIDSPATADLVALYSAAAVLVLPSHYEGFGLTVLEAMACGAPCIISDRGSLPEIAGGAAVEIDPDDVVEVAAALAGVLQESQLQQQLRHKGLVRAAEFSWERCARETLAVYLRVLGMAQGN